MSEIQSLQSALQTVINIRAKTAEIFKNASDGMSTKHGEDGKEKKFLSELKLQLDTINNLMKELEQQVNQPLAPLSLGHSVFLSMDAPQEMLPLYSSLTTSYKWLDKAHDYSAVASSYLAQNSLSRSYGKYIKGRRKTANTSHLAPPTSLDNLMVSINRLYGDMTYTITRPNDTKLNAIVEVKLERILTAVLLFKGLMIEWVVVRGFREDTGKGSPDVWTESSYEVFRRITENVNAGMLNFNSPVYPELAVKSFMTYLHSFVTLFTDKCRKCGSHLQKNIPPTWREFKSLEPYHEDCRPS